MSVTDGDHLLEHTHIDVMINGTTVDALYERIINAREFRPTLYLF